MANGTPGAPTVMTEVVLKKLEQAFSYGATDDEAAVYAGISARTLYNYCTDNPDYRERKEELKKLHFLAARESMVKALSSDPEFALKYMKAKKKDEFGSRVELSDPNGNPINTGHDELKAIAEALKNANSGRRPFDPSLGPGGLEQTSDPSETAM